MSVGDVFKKTPLGVQEMKDRKLNLSHRLRCMLILVDGVHPVSELITEARKLAAPEDFVEQLCALGLIVNRSGSVVATEAATETAARPEFDRFREAKDFMNSTIVDAIGIKSFFFTLKLERASTRADLKLLQPDYEKAISKGVGAEVAQVMVGRLQKMLG